jgi:hypothetical protein
VKCLQNFGSTIKFNYVSRSVAEFTCGIFLKRFSGFSLMPTQSDMIKPLRRFSFPIHILRHLNSHLIYIHQLHPTATHKYFRIAVNCTRNCIYFLFFFFHSTTCTYHVFDFSSFNFETVGNFRHLHPHTFCMLWRKTENDKSEPCKRQ